MGQRTQSFTVPLTNGNYAPEALYLGTTSYEPSGATAKITPENVAAFRLNVVTLVATSAIEVDFLIPNLPGGADLTLLANWRVAVFSFTAAGLQAYQDISDVFGVRVRIKSGGTAGTGVVDVSWRRRATGL